MDEPIDPWEAREGERYDVLYMFTSSIFARKSKSQVYNETLIASGVSEQYAKNFVDSINKFHEYDSSRMRVSTKKTVNFVTNRENPVQPEDTIKFFEQVPITKSGSIRVREEEKKYLENKLTQYHPLGKLHRLVTQMLICYHQMFEHRGGYEYALQEMHNYQDATIIKHVYEDRIQLVDAATTDITWASIPKEICEYLNTCGQFTLSFRTPDKNLCSNTLSARELLTIQKSYYNTCDKLINEINTI